MKDSHRDPCPRYRRVVSPPGGSRKRTTTLTGRQVFHRCPARRRSRLRRSEAPPVRAEKTGVTIPYPTIQPAPTVSPVTPPSGAPRPRVTFLGTGYLGATYAI